MDNMKTKEEIASELRDIQRRLFMIRMSLRMHHASMATDVVDAARGHLAIVQDYVKPGT